MRIEPILLAVLQVSDPQPTYRGRQRELQVPLPRQEAAVAVDGVLDEPAWRYAARLVDFSQYRPADGRPAEDSTEVLVWYQPDAIVFGIRAFEAHGPGAVRATLADRDQIDADDLIRILLDTYNDRRRALMFAVNPLGVQQDGIWSDGIDAGSAGGPGAGGGRLDASIDINPDFVFASAGRITQFGYQVELRIPFKSIRYQSAPTQDWGLQVMRVVQHSGYEDTWTPAVRASASFLVQAGSLVGLTGLRRGLVMEVTPEATTRIDGAPGASGEYRYAADPAAGGTLRWGITENLTLNATVNPDFSQVEADVGQVTVNERFALFFPEKRPFFLDGLEQYDTPNRLIYTRRITAPLAGVKIAGKLGSTNVAYLAAVDDNNGSVVGDHPWYNVLRMRRDLGSISTLGLAYTDRVEGSATNRVLGADTRIVWRNIWFTQAQAVRSWTHAGSSTRSGTLWDVTVFDRTGRSYGNHGEIVGVSPAFEAGSGFVPRTNFVQATLFNRFTWYGAPSAMVEQWSLLPGQTFVWRYDDFLATRSSFEGSVEGNLWMTLRGGWSVQLGASQDHQRFDPAAYEGYGVVANGGTDTTTFLVPHGLYRLRTGNVQVSTPNRALAASLNLGVGSAAIFAEAARGRGWSLAATTTWRPTGSIRIEARWVHNQIDRSRDGSRFSTSNIPRIKLEYQLTRHIFLRWVAQYVVEERTALRDPRSGAPLALDSVAQTRVGPSASAVTNDFRHDVLFSFKPTPGTVLFVGYGASLTEPEGFRFAALRRTGDGFFFKASYRLRL